MDPLRRLPPLSADQLISDEEFIERLSNLEEKCNLKGAGHLRELDLDLIKEIQTASAMVKAQRWGAVRYRLLEAADLADDQPYLKNELNGLLDQSELKAQLIVATRITQERL